MSMSPPPLYSTPRKEAEVVAEEAEEKVEEAEDAKEKGKVEANVGGLHNLSACT